jgi:DNA-binding transcriptional LysR family regulator
MDVSLREAEIKHLMALDAVADERSFGRAADRLGYTQSAVSQQIAALERAVGGRLFERPGGPRPIEITPLGSIVLEHAHDVLQKIDDADDAVRRFGAGIAGTLSVGTFQSVSVRMLPTILRRFRTDRPNVEVKLFETDDQDELEERLRDGRLDLAFLVEPFEIAGLRSIELCEDPFVAVSPLDEPISPSNDFIDVGAFDGVPLISQHDSACQRLIDGGLRDAGLDLNVVFRTADNSAVQAMVRAGMGHAVMPWLAVDANDTTVKIRRMDPGIPPRVICIARPDNRVVPPAADTFIDVAAETFHELARNSPLVDV